MCTVSIAVTDETPLRAPTIGGDGPSQMVNLRCHLAQVSAMKTEFLIFMVAERRF